MTNYSPLCPHTPYFGIEQPCVLVLSHVNSGGGNESLMEESLVLWRDGVDGERQRDTETREPDVVDGTSVGADINNHHRGSADKYRFNRSGYQVSEMGHKDKGGHLPVLTLPVVKCNQGLVQL